MPGIDIRSIAFHDAGRAPDGRFRLRLLVQANSENQSMEPRASHISFRIFPVGRRARPLSGTVIGILPAPPATYHHADIALSPDTYLLSMPGTTKRVWKFSVGLSRFAAVRHVCQHATAHPLQAERLMINNAHDEMLGGVERVYVHRCCFPAFLANAVGTGEDGALRLLVPERPFRHLVDGKEYAVRRGEYLAINPGSPDRPAPSTPIPSWIKHVVISRRILQRLRNAVGIPPELGPFGFDPRPRRLTSRLASAIGRLEETTRQVHRIGRDHSALSALEEIVLILLDEHPNRLAKLWRGRVETPPSDPRLLKAIDYLRTRFAEPYRAAEVARRAGVSEPVLRRLFRAHLNQSPVHYLQNYRMEKARALMRDGTRALKAIAAEVGYTDPSGFRRLFNRYMQRQTIRIPR